MNFLIYLKIVLKRKARQMLASFLLFSLSKTMVSLLYTGYKEKGRNLWVWDYSAQQ